MSKLTARFDSRVLVNATSRGKIYFDGREYAGRDEMPVPVRVAYDRAVHETPALHSGARLAAKLKARIIVNDTEFNHAGEMSVDDRHVYHEALEALFPPSITVFTSEPPKSGRNKLFLIAPVVSVLAGAVYFWLRSFFS